MIRLSEAKIIASFEVRTHFGLIECDIHVPGAKKKVFEEMIPIFKNIEVSRKDIRAFMQPHAAKHNILNGK